MDAQTYFRKHDGKLDRDGAEMIRVAAACGVSPYYLCQVSRGHKTPSPALAAAIEIATEGSVDRRDSLPNFPWGGSDAVARAKSDAKRVA